MLVYVKILKKRYPKNKDPFLSVRLFCYTYLSDLVIGSV